MGRVLSKTLRPIKNFNIENRMQKVIDSDKPRPAPRHPSTVAAYESESRAKDHQEVFNEQNTKNMKLDENLRKVQVNSFGDNPQVQAKSSRPLPEARSKSLPWEYGVPEPHIIPEGHVTLRQALEFISQHYLSPKDFSVERIAREYKLNKVDAENILKYFQALHMHIPKAMLDKNPKLLSAAEGLKKHRSLVQEDMAKLGDGSTIQNMPRGGNS